ncbi:MAG: DEAD/DEAH box helicase [Actinobacteria bacterium]|nr:DEAD/DEAH box helicase [Actinomycetota bacterium]
MSTTTHLAAFAARYPFDLDDYQIEACGSVESGSGVLVAAPTGAGKTVVGEFAVHLALAAGRKCFYTTPIKALSNQKYRDLVAAYGSDRIGLLTGDVSVNSEADVVVMTTEVLRNMIYASSSTLANLGFVVMDEVHYLADRFRGPVWEEVILGVAESVQVVALSATVSNAEEFGDWLREVRGAVDVVVSERRPVPLYQHVLAGTRLVDLFAHEAPTATPLPGARADVNPELVKLAHQESRYRDDARRPRGRSGKGKARPGHGSGGFGGATHPRWTEGGHSLVPRRSQMVTALDREGLLPAIVFVFSRQGCDGAVSQLIADGVRLTSAPSRRRLVEIAAEHTRGFTEEDLVALRYDRWLTAFQRGVAAHHAGLLPSLKEAVEVAFTEGLLKVVFATETLALGINMPARTVVVEKLVKYNGEAHADVTPGEYTQLTGRAGRRGIDVEGHAVVCWQPGLDPRAVAGLASRRTYPLRSAFRPTYNMAVNLVGTVGRDRARAVLEQSFAQFQSDRGVVAASRSIRRTEAESARLLEQASCELGDITEYAQLSETIRTLEAEAARGRRVESQAEALSVLESLKPGDIISVPAGRHRGWAAVVESRVTGSGGPTPLVMTENRQLKSLSVTDFPTPPIVAGRIRVPKHFDAKSAAARRNLAAAFLTRLGEVDLPDPRRRVRADDEVMAEIDAARRSLRAHPCHRCPDREKHARLTEQAMRLQREAAQARQRSQERSNTIATAFDRICAVLSSLGYLDEQGLAVTPSGRVLTRIYGELDLVTAQCVVDGVFDHLSAPQLAAVLSSLVFRARATDGRRPARMPDRQSEAAQVRLRAVWRDVGMVERDHRVERGPEPDIGFAEAAHAWASGSDLADVLILSGLPAGDVVRWVRQVIDVAGQVADAAGPGPLRSTCREIVASMRRGVVDVAEED